MKTRGIVWWNEVVTLMRQAKDGEVKFPGFVENIDVSDEIELAAYHVALKKLLCGVTRRAGIEIKYTRCNRKELTQLSRDYESSVDFLLECGVTDFVVLLRRNQLRFFLSTEKALQSGVWHVRVKGASSQPICLENVHFGGRKMSLMDGIAAAQKDTADLVAVLLERGVRLKIMEYGDDIMGDPRRGYSDLCHFLRLSPKWQRIELRRTNPEKLADLVADFDRVRELLYGSDYEWMLEDE